MMFNVAVQHGGPHLLVVGSGRGHFCDICGMVDLTARVALIKGYRRALVDLLAVDPELTASEHLQLGSHVASALAQLERVATVVAAQYRSGASEKSAQQHGLNLRTFTDIHQAEAWLNAA